MIDINKKYRTREGKEVRIYATDHSVESYPVAGAVKSTAGWVSASWTADGGYLDSTQLVGDDLIEVKPRIQRTMWLNVYPDFEELGLLHISLSMANRHAGQSRIACIPITIDCEEGEGLDNADSNS